MDCERGRDLKRSGSSGGRSLPAKRQQIALSARISTNTKSTSPISSFPSEKEIEKVAVLSGSSYGGGGGGEESAMERWKKEKAKAFGWGSGINQEYSRPGDRGGISGSDGGEQPLTRPPLSRSVGLRSKASEHCNAVGPAVVPRKLRSAMNKRTSLSASPPLPDWKNKLSASPPLPSSRNKCNASNGTRRCKRNKLNEPVTKDEEEAAEILSALASMIPDGRPVKIAEDGRMSEENSQTAATVVSHLEATSHALQPGLPSSGNGHLAMSSSSKAALWSDSATASCRTSSNGVSSNGSGLPTGKLPQVSADRRSSWKRCTTHVYISHIIQRYQKTEIEHQFLFLTNQSKSKEGTNSGVQESNEAIGISSLNSRTSAVNSGSIMESTDESRIQMLSGSYMQQQQAPHHSIMPVPFSQDPSVSRPACGHDSTAAATTPRW